MKPNTHRPAAPNDREMYEELIASKSDVMHFGLTRKPEPGRTFSAEGIETVIAAMRTFIGARIMHHWQENGLDGIGPNEMQITMQIALNGKSIEVPDEILPWYAALDGENRDGGLKH